MSTQAFAPGIPTSFTASLGAAKCSTFVTNALAKRKYSHTTAAAYGQIYGSGYFWVHSNWQTINSLVGAGNLGLNAYGTFDGAKTLVQIGRISSDLRLVGAAGALQGLVAALNAAAVLKHMELNPYLMSVADVSLDLVADAGAVAAAPTGLGVVLGVLSFASTIVDIGNLAVSCKPGR